MPAQNDTASCTKANRMPCRFEKKAECTCTEYGAHELFHLELRLFGTKYDAVRSAAPDGMSFWRIIGVAGGVETSATRKGGSKELLGVGVGGDECRKERDREEHVLRGSFLFPLASKYGV
jgi:hypothetical protein